MILKRSVIAVVVGLTSASAMAYPVDPAKVPVDIVDQSLMDDFILAFDSIDKTIVYYAPKGGRVALMNGQPLLGFAASAGGGFLNAQFEFGVFGVQRQQLYDAIKAAGYTPRPLPYVKTTVVPLTPIDPKTGKVVCEVFENLATGETEEDCSANMFTRLSFSTKGPSLGEYVPVTIQLNSFGALIYREFLKSGNALQIVLDAEYYAAGTGFTATVTVNYDRLFENFHAYAAYHDGFCTDVEIETFWEREGLCIDRAPEDCSLRVEYTDDRGRRIDNVTIDPDSKEAEEVYQAVERLRQELQKDMLTPMESKLDPLDTSKPSFGFKLNAKYERRMKGNRGTFEFKSPRGVNIKNTAIPGAIACIKVADNGNVSRDFENDCQYYWQGSLGWQEVLARQQGN